MNESLFGRLFKYRSSESRSPYEDYLSEAFAVVLQRCPHIAVSLFRSLTDVTVERVTTDTQTSYPRSDGQGHNRIDLRLIGENLAGGQHILFIESKLGSAEGLNQLSRYIESLRSLPCYQSRTLCYLTEAIDLKANIGDDAVRFVQKRWAGIYEQLRSQGEGNPLVEELLTFMEELGMAREVQMSELLAGVTHGRSQQRIMALLQDAWAAFEKRGCFTNGNLKGYYEQAINIWSPRELGAGARIVYGIWFDTSSPGWINLEFDDSEIPVAYAAIYHDENAPELYSQHQGYFDSLAGRMGERWTVGPQSAGYVVKRTTAVGAASASMVTDQIDTFFTETLKELAKAPFLDLPSQLPR